MRTPFTALALSIATTTLSAQWAENTAATHPSLRRSGAMAFQPGTPSGRLVLYGGTTTTPSQILDQTWTYNGTWTLQATVQAPPRWGHAMVLNEQNNRILTFGGRSPSLSTLANDTMEWTGTGWVTLPTPVSPSPRFLYGLTYDPTRNRVVLFGGQTITGASNEVWEYDGVTWSNSTPANGPAPRQEMVLSYDPGLRKVVMFGGCNEGTGEIFGDTWLFDGQWQQASPLVSPTPRCTAAHALDTVRKRIVVYGGYADLGTSLVISNETWEFFGDRWEQIGTGPTAPPNAVDNYYGYDRSRRKFVVFGGFGTSFSDDTWEYTGPTTGLVSTFGIGCATAAGEPTITGTNPTLAVPFVATFGNLPPEALAVGVALGLSNQTWQGLPLPFDLGVIGLPGCNLLVAADAINVVFPVVGGESTFQFPIANSASLLNVEFYVQGVPIDFTAFNQFLGTTRGLRCQIGN